MAQNQETVLLAEGRQGRPIRYVVAAAAGGDRRRIRRAGHETYADDDRQRRQGRSQANDRCGAWVRCKGEQSRGTQKPMHVMALVVESAPPASCACKATSASGRKL